ncbi:uncharacterized protein LOC103159787 [Cricetulus griseus]|uniref:Uncharacterized protein LOC103159787 n=1 Tax=Cricetulus griseus TaxID=10029 RepID=A0A9J7FHZ3_CRIGR|nr:uncharacterized protein LOC103159787 [Cricetulus griseus]
MVFPSCHGKKEGRADGGPGREGGGGTGRRRGRRPGVSPNFDNFPPHAAPPRPAPPPPRPTGRGGAQSPARVSGARNQALTPAALENPVRMAHRADWRRRRPPQRPEKLRQNAYLSGLLFLKSAGKYTQVQFVFSKNKDFHMSIEPPKIMIKFRKFKMVTMMHSLIVLPSFCQLGINLHIPGKRESLLKNCLHQTGLWVPALHSSPEFPL